MDSQKYNELIKNIKLKNDLLKLGIGCNLIGPTGPKGEKGDKGDSSIIPPSTTIELISTSFENTNESKKMLLEDIWKIPTPSTYFEILNESDIQVQPGIYEIVFSGLIKEADSTHGATFYLQTEDGEALADFTYELPASSSKQMHFSQDTIFRFEKLTVLQVISNISGDVDTSNIQIVNVNLLLKKIQE